MVVGEFQSHTRTVRSVDETRAVPSGVQATSVTPPLCPLSVTSKLPRHTSQTDRTPVKTSPTAARLPSGLMAVDQISRPS